MKLGSQFLPQGSAVERRILTEQVPENELLDQRARFWNLLPQWVGPQELVEVIELLLQELLEGVELSPQELLEGFELSPQELLEGVELSPQELLEGTEPSPQEPLEEIEFVP